MNFVRTVTHPPLSRQLMLVNSSFAVVAAIQWNVVQGQALHILEAFNRRNCCTPLSSSVRYHISLTTTAVPSTAT